MTTDTTRYQLFIETWGGTRHSAGVWTKKEVGAQTRSANDWRGGKITVHLGTTTAVVVFTTSDGEVCARNVTRK